jgi:hypothetical protein
MSTTTISPTINRVTFKLHRLVKKASKQAKSLLIYYSISAKAEWVCMRAWPGKMISHIQVELFYFFPTSPIKRDYKIGGKTTNSNPTWNQSNYLPNQKHREQSNEYDRTVLLIRLFQGLFWKLWSFFKGPSSQSSIRWWFTNYMICLYPIQDLQFRPTYWASVEMLVRSF